MAKNMGRHLSIDESMYCGRLYTFVSNKDARGGHGTIIAIIAGVKAETVLRWLLEIPEEERRGVLDVSMDFSDSMKLIAKTAFPCAKISLDHFHVFQDLNKYFMKAFAEVRDKVLVAIKHEKAAVWFWRVCPLVAAEHKGLIVKPVSSLSYLFCYTNQRIVQPCPVIIHLDCD